MIYSNGQKAGSCFLTSWRYHRLKTLFVDRGSVNITYIRACTLNRKVLFSFSCKWKQQLAWTCNRCEPNLLKTLRSHWIAFKKQAYKGSKPTRKKSGFTRLSLRILVAGERFNIKSSHRLPNISQRIQRSKQRILPSPPWIYKDAYTMAKFTWHWMIAPCIHTVLFNIFPLFTQNSEQLSSWFHVNGTPKHTNFEPVKNLWR